MKICMYNLTTTTKIGGIETFYWEVSHELMERGYEVELICGEGNYIKYSEIPRKMFSFTPRESILDLGNRFRKWGERLSFFKKAWPYLKRQHYDLFFIHKPLDFFTAYFIKKNNSNIKTVFMSGGEDFYGLDKFFARYIDHMFAVSKDNAEKIEKRYKRNILVIPNGVNVEKFKPMPNMRKKMRSKYNLDDKTVLISVGRVVGLKGFQHVMEVLLDLPDYHYVLIGDGEYLPVLRKLAKTIGVFNRVHFLGAIDNSELPQYLNMGDVFIQPTIGNEAFGITIIEAMACGVPVVASRNGGIVDIVDEKTNGLMFETGNIDEMKLVIEKVKKSSWSPREYVERFFTWERTVDKIFEVIERDHKA